MDLLTELIVKNVISEKADRKTINIRTKSGASVFSMNKLTQGLAIFSLLIMVSVRIFFAVDPFNQLMFNIGLAAIFTFIGVPLFLYQVVSKVFIYPDKIVRRNLMGIKKTMCWDEIKAAYFSSSRGALRLFGEKKNIKIGPMFNGFYYIVTAVAPKLLILFQL